MSESETEPNVYENFSFKAHADNITTTRQVNHYEAVNPTLLPENFITLENQQPFGAVKYQASQQVTINVPVSSNTSLGGRERSVPSASEYGATTASTSYAAQGKYTCDLYL